ncbi:MAG: hypothetical protein ABI852_08315 [Gemmatimonadaceae bacterium]
MNFAQLAKSLVVLGVASVMARPVLAQSLRVVAQGDSALLIVSLSACATTCPDSARIEWRYGGQYLAHKIRRATVDTARFVRIQGNSSYSDTARIVVTPLPLATSAIALAAFVAPIAVVSAPATAAASGAATPTTTGGSASNTSQSNGPPASYISTPVTGSFVQPTAPATFSTTYPTITGRQRRVLAGQDLQAVLNAAQPGDEIVLANGATFTGNFVLPPKTGAGWIVVRGDVAISAPGTRIDPKMLLSAGTIVTNNSDPAIRTGPGASRWRLVGFEISHATGARYNYGIVVLGRGDELSVDLMPTDIVLDRMFVHGSTTDGNSRCVAFNGKRLAVIQSWLTECHAKGADAQGVCGWGGPGPFLIENNRIEASGQAVMFGGADPRVTNLSPSDIVIRRNYFYKPLTWGRGKWSVKAAFELKHGRRVVFEGNVIENHWADAQTGFAILFQTLADNNRSWAWTTVQDVVVQNNIIRNSTSGVNILSRVAYHGGTMPTNPTSRVAVVNNLFENVGADPVSRRPGIIVQLLGDLVDFTFANNTATLESGRANKSISFDGPPATHTTLSDNVFPPSAYAVTGNATQQGTPTLNAFMPGGVFRNNVLPGQAPNIFAAGAVTSSARGANMSLIRQATAGVVK